MAAQHNVTPEPARLSAAPAPSSSRWGGRGHSGAAVFQQEVLAPVTSGALPGPGSLVSLVTLRQCSLQCGLWKLYRESLTAKKAWLSGVQVDRKMGGHFTKPELSLYVKQMRVITQVRGMKNMVERVLHMIRYLIMNIITQERRMGEN